MIPAIIVGLFLFLYTVIILYYRWGWNLSGRSASTLQQTATTRFSIIIAARNEATHINACLDSIQKLNYPKDLFQIIVVDDHSEDHTAALVRRYDNVMLLQLKDYPDTPSHAYKKHAITLGISKSTGDYIVTTDADCIVPVNWLLSLDQMIQQQNSVCIAAPVVLEKGKGLLHIFESIDFMMLQGITAAAVHTGLHVMSNGANFCYRTSAFQEADGFKDADQISSGDDMLLMQKFKKRFPQGIHYCRHREAIVTTKGSDHIGAFLMQRIRWASKGRYYTENRLKLILLAVFLFNLSLLLLMIASPFNPSFQSITLIAFSIKIMVEGLFLYPVATFFNRKDLLLFFIPLQPLHVIYMVGAAFLGYFTKYTWKGRRVR